MRVRLDELRPAPEGWTHARTIARRFALLERRGVTEVSAALVWGAYCREDGLEGVRTTFQITLFRAEGSNRWAPPESRPGAATRWAGRRIR